MLSPALFAQAREGMLSDREVEELRDTAAEPAQRLRIYERILDDREKAIEQSLGKRHGADFAADMHDLFEQVAGIADELNDNLDEWGKHHRDLRKLLPKLITSTDKWSTTLRAPEADAHYDIVRREALAAVKDMHELALSLSADQAAYFKAHPDDAAKEKRRAETPGAPES